MAAFSSVRTPQGTGSLPFIEPDFDNGEALAFNAGLPEVSSGAVTSRVVWLSASEDCFVTIEGTGSPSRIAGEATDGAFFVGKGQVLPPIMVPSSAVFSVVGDGTAGALFILPAATA